MNIAPACRGFLVSRLDPFSPRKLAAIARASGSAIIRSVLIALCCASAIPAMYGGPVAATALNDSSPLPLPIQLVSIGMKDWTGESKPDFILERLQGGKDQLSHYKHRIVLVYFFATWCASCHDGITSLQRLAEQLNDPAIAILAVDVADLDLRAQRYFQKHRVNFPVLLDRDRETAKAWDVYSLPATFILDKSLSVKYWTETSVDWSRPEIADFLNSLANR